MAGVRLLTRLLLFLLCTYRSPATEETLATAAFGLALAPAPASATPGGPRPKPQLAELLNALLDSIDSPATAEHWQGSVASLEALRKLVRSGRRALALSPPPPTTQQQEQQQQQEQRQEDAQQPPDPRAVSSWLASAAATVAAVPKGPSYPQLRRVVTALLAAACEVSGASWSKSNDDVAARALLKLYELHAAAALRKSAIEYFHFSKAAGTSVCVMSDAMGCTTFSATEQYTCLVPEFGDGPRWMNRKAHNARCRRALPGVSKCLTKVYTKLAKWGLRYNTRSAVVGCVERAVWLADRGFNFYASEYTLRGRGGNVTEPPALCEGFLNLAVLRAPQARLWSHMRYIVRVTYDYLGEGTTQYLQNFTLQDWRRLLPAALDNIYTRSLLGETAFYTRTGELTAAEHLPAARGVLAAMDVLMVMEESEPLLRLSHKWGLGWRGTFLQAEGRSSSRAKSEAMQLAEQVLPTGPAAAELVAANHLDEQLYEYAVLLSRLDAVVWAAAEAAGITPPEATMRKGAERATRVVGGRSGGGGRGGSSERGPCGYVPPVWPKPPAPPLAPNASWVPPPVPALKGGR